MTVREITNACAAVWFFCEALKDIQLGHFWLARESMKIAADYASAVPELS